MHWIPPYQRKPHLFLSHSSFDKTFARKLAKDLNTCAIDVWFDEWEIGPGSSLYDKLAQGLQDSSYVGLILSEAFLNSKWTSNELKQAIQKEMNEGTEIILPLLIEKLNTLPAFLNDKIHISFIENYYVGLLKLAAVLHNLEARAIADSLGFKIPNTIGEVLELLSFNGLKISSVIPKEVFEEIANTGLAKVIDNTLTVNLDKIKSAHSLSNRTRQYIKQYMESNDYTEPKTGDNTGFALA